MKWLGGGLLAALLALPAAWADDPPKDKDQPAKEEKKLTPGEQYAALVKEYRAKQQELRTAYQKAKEDAEKEKVVKEFGELGGKYADRFARVAEDDPKGPAGTDALFWILQNAPPTAKAHETAAEKVKAFVNDTPLKDLVAKLKGLRGAPPAVLDAALARAEKEAKDPQAGDLVAWVATGGPFTPAGKKAADLVLDKYPDHPSVDQVVAIIGRAPGTDGEARLKALLEKDSKRVKAAAALALGRALASKLDRTADAAEADKVAAEAEKYLTTAIDLNKDSPDRAKAARVELNAVKNLRVGKEAPDIKAPDLDGKEFKLSDYRGKVVLLDFWGNW